MGHNWKPCWTIAMTDVITDEDELEEDIYPVVPAEIDGSWERLGYDVADVNLTTGLSDGVLEPDTAERLRSQWQDHLNQYHLFENPNKALEYIGVANERVPSHVPFYVYGLYLVARHD
jgi:hypothetical protein